MPNSAVYSFFGESRPLPLKTETPATVVPAYAYVTLSNRGLLHIGEDLYRILTRLPDGEWSALRLEKDRLSANFQGNPLWPKLCLAAYPGLSQYFGLSASATATACILPMAKTVNRALGELFAGQGFKAFGFAEGINPSERSYVDLFIDEGKLPMADVVERDSIHDWSYHFMTLLFPEYLENVRLTLKHIRDHLSLFSGSTAYAWNYYGHSLDENENMKGHAVIEEMPYEAAIYRQMAISLDVATAKIVQLLGLARKGLLHKCRREVDLLSFFSNGVSMEGLQNILYLEKNLNMLAPKSTCGHKIDDAPMKYLFSSLEKLEKKAAGRVNQQSVLTREMVFAEIFARSLK